MFSNAFCSDANLPSMETYRYIPIDEIEPRALYSILNSLRGKFFRMGISAAIRGQYVFVADTSKTIPETIESGGARFKRDSELTILHAERDGKLIADIVRESFLRASESAGYKGRKGQKLHSKIAQSKKFIDIYDGFQYEIEVVEDGKVIIWIDPAAVWRLPLTKYINALRADGLSNQEIQNTITGSRVRVPSVRKFSTSNALIDSVKFTSIGDYKLKDLGISLFDYWQKDNYRYYLRSKDIALDYSDCPVVSVRYPGMNTLIDFPAKVCELHIDLEDPQITGDIRNKLKFVTEKEHVVETKRIASKILGNGLLIGGNKLNFSLELLNWSQVSFGVEQLLTVPSLTFGRNQEYSPEAGSEPVIRSALYNYGPVTQKENIKFHIIAPKNLETYLGKLTNYLNEVGRGLNLPKLTLTGSTFVTSSDPDEYRLKSRALRGNDDIDAVMVILEHRNESQIYNEAKRGLGEVFLKSQMIKESTFKNLIDQSNYGRVYTASIIVTQMYGKILVPGESIWHLSKGAGGIPNDEQTFFMAFDVSRNNELKREAAAYSAICDPQGRVLTRKKVPFKGEKVGSIDLSEWFFDAALDAYESNGETKKLDSLVLFKDGDIKDSQISEYVEGCNLAMKRMIKSNLMSENGNLAVIAAIKRGPQRLFGSKEEDYKLKNSAVIRNESEAIIVTYGNDPKSKRRTLRGTPQPIRLKLIHQAKQVMTIQQVVQMFNDLRYLDYSSLMKQPKTILPLHIVQNLAKLIKEGIEVPYDPR